MPVRLASVLLVVSGLLWSVEAASAETPQFSATDLEFFEKNVRPVLVARCYECHSSKLEEPKGGLSLDSRAASLAGGETGAAVVPGKLKDSLLIDAIKYGDLFQMPPKSKLPASEIAVLTKWVEMGAPWPAEEKPQTTTKHAFDLAQRKAEHWAWRPIQTPAPIALKNAAWAKSPIDAFILAKLEAKGLTANGPAEKSTLLRRAYFDLIGLPPTPEQVAAFIADDSPQAFEKVVDELLKSPHFGERWGRHWLDLVRYAESRGHEFDYDIPNVWHYRDYVIRAFNADVPYDQFVTEHIAGDLLEKPRIHPTDGFNESVLGTGFWHLGEWIHSPVDIRKDECDRFDNMVDVFSKTFLAMTVSCARCHDHKFDAISQKDYYALYGYLQSSEYRQAAFDTEVHNRDIAAQLAKLDDATRNEVLQTYAAATAPALQQLPTVLQTAQRLLTAEGQTVKPESIAAAAEAAKIDATLLGKWINYLSQAAGEKEGLFQPLAEVTLAPADKQAALLQQKHQQALEIKQKAAAPDSAKYRVVIDYNDPTAEFITDGFAFGLRPVRQGELLVRTHGDGKLVAAVQQHGAAQRDTRWKGLTRAPGTQPDSGQLGRFETAGQTLRTPTFEITHDKVAFLVQGAGRAFAAVDSHRLINGPLHGQTITEWENAVTPRWVVLNLGAYQGHRIHIEFSPRGDEDLRVYKVICGEPPAVEATTPAQAVTPLFAQSADLAAVSSAHATALTEALKDPALSHWLAWLVEHTDLLLTTTESEKLSTELAAIASRYHTAQQALTSQIKRQSRTAPAMWDGSGEDERLFIRGNHTTPRDLVPRRFLSALAGEEASKYTRGSGRLHLAEQVLAEDNPLTARVMANRIWYHLLGRGIVPSTDNFGVLGQEPTHPELLDYLANDFRREDWSVKRLIKSIMLSSTYQMSSAPGDADREADPQNLLWHRANIRRLEAEVIRDQMLVLSGRLNDKMFGPAVPVFLTPYMQGRGRPGSGPLDGDGRRSIYVSVRRNFLSPMMLAFDAPVPFSTMGKRNVSNVPAQALTLMNDPFVVDQAKLWAQRTLADPSLSQADARIERLYQQAFARSPSAAEVASAKEFLAAQALEHKLSPEAARDSQPVWADLCHVLMNVKEFIFIP